MPTSSVPWRPLLVELRGAVARGLPEAEEAFAYNMPGFRIAGTIAVGYAFLAKQCGVYVAPEVMVTLLHVVAAAGLKATKTGVTLSPRKPMPTELVRRLNAAVRAAHRP